MASKKPPSYVKRDRTPALGAPNTGDRALNLFIQNIHERLERLNSETAASIASIRSRLVEVEGDGGGGGGGSGTSDAVVYRGAWDASTGSPPSTSPAQGDYYVVSVDGATSLSGITDWFVGDWAVYNGTDWNIVRNWSITAGDNITLTAANGSIEIAAGVGAPPYLNEASETYTVPALKQVLYAQPIVNDGLIVVDGLLISVPTSADADDLPITTVTGDTSLNATHYTVLVDASGGNVNIGLPSASSVNQRIFNIKKIDSSGNIVTVVGTVDDAVNPTLSLQYDSISVQSDGTEYWLL